MQGRLVRAEAGATDRSHWSSRAALVAACRANASSHGRSRRLWARFAEHNWRSIAAKSTSRQRTHASLFIKATIRNHAIKPTPTPIQGIRCSYRRWSSAMTCFGDSLLKLWIIAETLRTYRIDLLIYLLKQQKKEYK